MLKCTKCGADIGNAEVYCPICGALRPPPPPGMKCCGKCQNYIPKAVKICPVCKSNQRGVLSCSGMLGALLFLIILPFIISAINNIMIGYNSAAEGPNVGKSVTSSGTPMTITAEKQEIIEYIKTTAESTLGSDTKVDYCEETNTYTLLYWREGFCGIVIAGNRTQEWVDMATSAAVVSSTFVEYIREHDPTGNMCFMILNEYDHSKALLISTNGKIEYDALAT